MYIVCLFEHPKYIWNEQSLFYCNWTEHLQWHFPKRIWRHYSQSTILWWNVFVYFFSVLYYTLCCVHIAKHLQKEYCFLSCSQYMHVCYIFAAEVSPYCFHGSFYQEPKTWKHKLVRIWWEFCFVLIFDILGVSVLYCMLIVVQIWMCFTLFRGLNVCNVKIDSAVLFVLYTMCFCCVLTSFGRKDEVLQKYSN